MRHDVVSSRRHVLKFVVAVVVGVDGAFQLKNRDQSVVNRFAAVAERDGAAQCPCRVADWPRAGKLNKPMNMNARGSQ